MRIVFLGTRDIALPALDALLRSSEPDWRVVGVFTQPDRPAGRSKDPVAPPVKAVGEAAGIPIYQPASWRDDAAIQALRDLNPDVGVVASYAQLLPRRVLRIPTAGWLNIHPSLLPRHRGPSPVAAAILAGDTVTGVSIIKLVSAMDAGPIIDQVRIHIRPDDTTGSLTARLGDVGAQLLPSLLDGWVAGRATPLPQDESGATYSRLLTKHDGQLDWSLPAGELERRVRAFDPWPGTFTTWHGRRLGIRSARALTLSPDAPPGTVLRLEKAGDGMAVYLATADGMLAVDRLHLEGRKEIDADAFVRGHPTFLGVRLGQA